MTDVEVIAATPDARASVVDTVVAAFAADPAFRYFFRDGGAFEAEAATFAGYLFDRRVGAGTVWVVDGGASVAMWDAPDATSPAPGAPLTSPSSLSPPELDLPAGRASLTARAERA